MNIDGLKEVDLQTLMQKDKRIVIWHGDKPYQLAITRRGKLILTAIDLKLL